MMFISEGARGLAQSIIDDPHGWVQTDYDYVSRKRPDIQIWTANGASYIKLNGNDCFGFWEKRLINNAIKQATALKTMNP